MKVSTNNVNDPEAKRVIDAILDKSGIPATTGIKDRAVRDAIEAILDDTEVSFDNIKDVETRRVLQSLQK